MPARACQLLYALALVGGLACAPRPGPPPASASERPPPPAMTVRARPGSDSPALPAAEIEPELLELLTAHRRPAAPPAPAEERARCHPERPDSPRERSLCVCESACARTIDREALARRLLGWGSDPETTRRWLSTRDPIVIHYPYMDIDGLRIEYDGDGKPTRCTHSSGMERESFVALECASLAPAGARVSP